MVTIVFIGLCCVAAMIAIAGIVIFLRAAFAGKPDRASQGREAWRPAFVSGDVLKEWTANKVETFATPQLARNDAATSARHIAADVGERATEVMLPFAHRAELERVVPCGDQMPGRLGLTGVEAIAIAAEIRRVLSPADQQRLLELARANVAQLKAGAATPGACPLRAVGGICQAYVVRPWPCRAEHARAVAVTRATVEVPAGHEAAVLEGATLGFARALRATGHDAHRYELNSALVAALGTPDAAADFAVGKPIFSECLPA